MLRGIWFDTAYETHLINYNNNNSYDKRHNWSIIKQDIFEKHHKIARPKLYLSIVSRETIDCPNRRGIMQKIDADRAMSEAWKGVSAFFMRCVNAEV